MLKFTIEQLKFLAEVSRDIGQIFFAGWVISPIITQGFDFTFLLLGLTVSLAFWYIGLQISKRISL